MNIDKEKNKLLFLCHHVADEFFVQRTHKNLLEEQISAAGARLYSQGFGETQLSPAAKYEGTSENGSG